MHPSYYTNERYKKIYKTVLQDDKQEPSDDEEKDTVRRDETGIPLSNQILNEKLDYTQSKNKKGRNKSHFEIALKQL